MRKTILGLKLGSGTALGILVATVVVTVGAIVGSRAAGNAAPPPVWRDTSGQVHFSDRARERFFKQILAHGVQSARPWPVGIFSGPAPFPSSIYSIENEWQGLVSGSHLQVYAGGLSQNPSQGVVIVQQTSVDLANVQTTVVETPDHGGALRITDARSLSLYLVGSTGERYVFNVVSRTFARQ
jgi:hypothetical protein